MRAANDIQSPASRDDVAAASAMPAHAQPPPQSRRGVSLRAVVLGLLLAGLNALWVTMVEVRYYILDGSSLPLFITPIFLLFVLVGANAILRRVSPRLALSQPEMLVAYLMAVVSNTFAGHDMLQNMFGSITHPYHFATPENGWQELFLRRLRQACS
jgi:hypothetical protein